MDRQVVAILCQYRERQRFMKGLFASLGFRQAIVHYSRPERSAGETKFRPLRLWTLAVEGIISFSTKPLKIWTYIGRSEEHTSELQSLMRISYAVFCLNKKNTITLELPII